jgi:tRNA G37 N-methylase Trm5
LRRPTDEEVQQISHSDSATVPIQIVPLVQQTPSNVQKSQGPYEKMSEILSKETLFSNEAINHLPKKWERIGHVLIIKKLHLEYFQSLENSLLFEQFIANTLLDVVGNGVETVVVDEQGVQGNTCYYNM